MHGLKLKLLVLETEAYFFLGMFQKLKFSCGVSVFYICNMMIHDFYFQCLVLIVMQYLIVYFLCNIITSL